MQVILLDKVSKLGNLGDKVDVKTGYVRNYLIPKGKAVPATKKNVEFFEKRRVELAAKSADIQAAAEERAKNINELGRVTIAAKTGEGGKLFGSIGARDIANAITASGVNVLKKEIRLPNGVLRTIGEHSIKIQIHNDIFAILDVVIISKI